MVLMGSTGLEDFAWYEKPEKKGASVLGCPGAP